jgi:hypothetical protein
VRNVSFIPGGVVRSRNCCGAMVSRIVVVNDSRRTLHLSATFYSLLALLAGGGADILV